MCSEQFRVHPLGCCMCSEQFRVHPLGCCMCSEQFRVQPLGCCMCSVAVQSSAFRLLHVFRAVQSSPFRLLHVFRAVQSSAFRLLDDRRLLNDDRKLIRPAVTQQFIPSEAMPACEGRRSGGVPKWKGDPTPCSANCQFAVFFPTRLRFMEHLRTPSRFTKRTNGCGWTRSGPLSRVLHH